MTIIKERLLHMPYLTIDDVMRFWRKVNKKDCWLWTASINNGGYGNFRVKELMYLAHRISYLINIKDPLDELVLHECNNPSCVNPNHLFLGTQFDNNQYTHDCGRNSKKGELHHLTHLSDSDVIKIKHLLKEQNLTMKQIANLFGVLPHVIYDIKRERNWNHIVV